MNRNELAHVLRAASRITSASDLVVLGSQAILGELDEDELPEEATRSVEADIAFWDDPGNEKSDDVDGSIGEASPFHQTFGYYAQGVSISTAVLPVGWEERCIPFDPANGATNAACIDKHDLVVSKLVAGRPKDMEFARSLLRAGLIDAEILHARADALPRPQAVITRVRRVLQ